MSAAPPPAAATGRGGVPARELATAAVLSALGLLAAVALGGAADAFGRVPDIDEVLTLLLAGDPSPRHAWQALRDGVDTNPPTLYLLVRAAGALTGGFGPTLLRGLTFAALWIACVGIYGVLRRSFDRAPSWAGVLVVAGHALVLEHAFDGRFYLPWLAILAWLGFVLSAPLEEAPSAGRSIALAGLSIGLCTIHYFGIITLALVVAGDALARWPVGRRWLGDRIALLAGPLALGLTTPLLLEQGSAYSTTAWIPPLDASTGLFELRRLVDPMVVALAVPAAAVLVGASVRALRGGPTSRPRPAPLGPLLAFVALAALPLVLAVFSLLAQPAYKARYSLAFVLAGAPLAAFLTSRLAKPLQWGAVIVLLALGASVMHDTAVTLRRGDRAVAGLGRVIGQLPAKAPVMFELVHDLYPLCAHEGGCSPRYALYDDPTRPGRWDANLKVVSRELGMKLARHYDGPRILSVRDRPQLDGFFFVASGPVAPAVLEAAFPGFAARPILGRVVQLRRAASVR